MAAVIQAILTHSAFAPVSGFATVVLIALFFLFYTLNIVAEAILINCKKFVPLLTLNLCYALLFVGIHWLVIQETFSMYRLIMFLCIITAAKFLVSLWWLTLAWKQTDIDEASARQMKRAGNLWMHLYLYDVIQILARYIDKAIVFLTLPAAVSATYYFATIDIPFLPVAFMAVKSSALILLNRSAFSTKYALDVIKKSSKIVATLSFSLLCFLMVYRREVISVVLSDKYVDDVLPIFVIALLKLPVTAFSITFFLQYKHRGNIINKGAVLDLVLSSLLVYPMYRLWGLQGVIACYVGVTYVQVFYYSYAAAKLLNVSVFRLLPYYDWGIKTMVFGTIVFVLHTLLEGRISSLYSLCIASCLIAAITLLWLIVEYRQYNFKFNNSNLYGKIEKRK
jgi:O-antigen/teichoic acid export membrane protein